jgi:hypothetical protein
MAFANFFVSEGEITKQFKGCYRNSGNAPAAGDRGTIQGSWQPSPIPNIKPVQHSSIEGLYIYPGQTGGYTQAWENAQYRDVPSSGYGLTIKNISPKKTIEQCMKDASNENVSVFSVSNLGSNNLAQCLAGNQVDDNPSNLIEDYPNPWLEFIEEIEGENPRPTPVDEQSCLKRKDANTVYNIVRDGPNPAILGNTYLGKSAKQIVGPGPNVRGTIQGSWQPSPIPNIKPVKHMYKDGLFIFAGQTGDWTKMVGMQYGDPNGPVRVDGKAFQPPVKSINSKSVTEAWEKAQDNGIDSAAYGLSITNGGDDKFSYAEKWELSEYPDNLLQLGTDYKEMKNYYATIEDAQYDLEGGEFSRVYKSPEECKQICVNIGQDCAGFIYDTEQNYCSLKNKMYPNVSGKPMDNEDSYIRMPTFIGEPSNGCPSNIKPVSSKFLVENGVFLEEPASLEYKCSDIGSKKSEEIAEINKLDDSYKLLKDDVSNLQTENNQILKGFQEVRRRFMKQVGSYDKVTNNMKKIHDNPTKSQMLTDMNTLSKSFSLQNSGMFMLLILFVIILMRVMRK